MSECFENFFEPNIRISFSIFSVFTSVKVRVFHCVKSVRIQSYSGPYSVRMRRNLDQNNPKYKHFLCSVFNFTFRLNKIDSWAILAF